MKKLFLQTYGWPLFREPRTFSAWRSGYCGPHPGYSGAGSGLASRWRLRDYLSFIAALRILLCVGTSLAVENLSPITLDFEQDQAGSPPAGFSFGKTGGRRPGRWVVVSDGGTPSGEKVLAQVDADPADYRFPVAVANTPLVKDFRFLVRCKLVSGQVDQAAGLVFRYEDENNYYVTRANALEGNVRLYKVVHGRRQQLAGWDGSVKAGVWHTYQIEARGDHFEVLWDGQRVILADDGTFPKAGRVGVWTKADSVTYFDDLSIEPLGS